MARIPRDWTKDVPVLRSRTRQQGDGTVEPRPTKVILNRQRNGRGTIVRNPSLKVAGKVLTAAEMKPNDIVDMMVLGPGWILLRRRHPAAPPLQPKPSAPAPAQVAG